jgi:hypothetical protein
MTCEYKKLCALYEHGSFHCGLFSHKCQYHHEFNWYDKQVVKENTDRIRMQQVSELEKEFDKT